MKIKKKNKMINIKKHINVIKNNRIIILFSILFFFIFIIFDLFLRLSIGNLNTSENLINLLAFKYDLLFITVFYIILNIINQFVSKRIAKFYLIVIYFGFFIVFLVDYIILKLKDVPLSIELLFFKDEGLSFVNYLADSINFSLLIFLLIIISFIIISIKLFNKYSNSFLKNIQYSIIYYIIMFVIVIILFISTRFDLFGSTLSSNTPRKFYYDDVSDSIDSYVVLGLYEFMFRDIVLSYSEKYKKENSEEITNFLNSLDRTDKDNSMTGLFKDKNLIMILLESMDNYVINENDSPNIINLRENGWNFKNRYSYLSVGGSTIHTEFSSINGLYYGSNTNTFSNLYPQSIPSMFNNNGYKTTSMHQNTGEYYHRNVLHKNEYFQNSYFLLDIDSDCDYTNDMIMVDNDKYYDWIVPKDGNKFMSFIITYSAHGPYNEYNCNGLAESACFKSLASITDNFIGRLVERLKEDDLLDDTVLLLYTDHQSYAFNYPKDYLNSLNTVDKEKNIKRIPFIIFSTDIKHHDYEMLVNDIDLAPTIFNLFGFDYDPNYYLGVDIFSKDHKNLLMFNNNLWYDGKSYGSNVAYDNYEYTYNIFRTSNMINNFNYYYKMSKKKNKG